MTTMDKTHRQLGILLAAQVLLAALLGWWQWREPASTAGQPLLAFNMSAADKLVIEGPDKARVELVRKNPPDGKGSAWAVTQAGDFAADAARVEQLLGRLHTVVAGTPVATSADAAERFKVADGAFERRITIEAGGKPLASLLLGSSQGARQTHARKGGTSEVHAIELAAHEVPVKVDDWLDKTALRMPVSDITGLALDGLELTRSVPVDAAAAAASAAASAPPAAPSLWQAKDIKPDERVDSAAADRLAQALADLRFSGLRGRDESARKDLGKVELTVGVRRRDGQRIDYTLRELPAGDGRALLVSNRPETFTLTQAQAQALADAAARKTLVPPETTATH